jgi:hypothetical protein
MDWFSSGRRDIASRNTIIKAYKGNTSAGHIRIASELGSVLLVRLHKTLRIIPAMAASVTDRVWSLEELIERTSK